MSLIESGSATPKYRIIRTTYRGDQVVGEETLFYFDIVHLESEHPCYDCGIHDDLSFAVDAQAVDFYRHTFQKSNGRYWIDTDDPRTPDQLCERCVLLSYDTEYHSMYKKKVKEVDYYEGDWSCFPAS